MKFILEINLGNDAMREAQDVGHALERVAERLFGRAGREELGIGDDGPIRDLNGNAVGRWEIIED